MHPPLYLLLRWLRRNLPTPFVRALLRARLVIRPGLETSDPQAAFRRYTEVLHEAQRTWQGQRVLLFGYGGRFGVGCALWKAGAAFVGFCDPYAPPDEALHQRLLATCPQLEVTPEGVRPAPRHGALYRQDVRTLARLPEPPKFDLVLSSSVLEHVDDLKEIVQALAALTAPEGLHIHFVDLRDHFFRYPFEMLTFSEDVWRRWLNPTSNLNRCRVPDYRRAFEQAFEQVTLRILQRDPVRFRQTLPRIRPEFLTGDPEVDSATHILILAQHPRRPQS